MVREPAILIIELVVLFFGVTLLIQLLQRRMGSDRVRAWLGGNPVVAALKGIAIGFVTPFCTFTAIPLLIGLRQARVPAAGFVAFIVAAPILDPVLFGALVLIAGFDAALIYVAVAFSAAVLLALAAEVFTIERYLKPVPTIAATGACTTASTTEAMTSANPTTTSANPTTTSAEPPTTSSTTTTATATKTRTTETWTGFRHELGPAAVSAARLLRSMGPLLLLGVTLSLIIDATVSPDITAGLTDLSPALAIPIAGALGTPLYVSTAVFIPVADSLQNAGVGIGSIVALTIAGAGANVPEFVILTRLARPFLVGLFFTFVFAVAVVGGLLAHVLVA